MANYSPDKVTDFLQTLSDLSPAHKKLLEGIITVSQIKAPIVFPDDYFAGLIGEQPVTVALDLLDLHRLNYIEIKFPGSDENWKREITLTPHLVSLLDNL